MIYKKFHKYIKLKDLEGIQWFALTSDYGKEYGNITVTYKFKKEPLLLDIGKTKIRKLIEDYIVNFEPNFRKLSDPDNQYSGGPGNKLYHNAVHKYLGDKYDGTIIDESTVDDEELEGPTEIVLWNDFKNNLIEISKTDNNIKKSSKKLN
jgi:hypothetical protein